MTEPRKLAPMAAAFCQEYLIDLNGKQAATRAGYSEKTAAAQASRLLTNVNVQAEIECFMKKRAEKVELTADEVLKDIKLVKADCMQAVFDKDGNRVMANPAAALKALELQGRHLKMFTDKLEVDMSADLALRMKEARERTQQG